MSAASFSVYQPKRSLPLGLIFAWSLLGAFTLGQSAPLQAAELTQRPAAQQQTPKSSVADLRYGVALYHYYQQDYLSALSELMVADTRDGIQGHGNNPELIAGGVSLAFGMQQHAEAVFRDILQDQSRPQAVRDAAWFYLGKLHYLRADWAAAEQSFARVSATFSPRLRAQMDALLINIHIRQHQFTDYQTNQVDRAKLRSWSPYVLYNLGAAHARAGEFKQAQTFFSELIDSPLGDSGVERTQTWALQDKAYTAMGYSYLAQKSYSAAIKKFTRVRLEGLFANQALLGYGWALAAQEEYTKALRPWQMLRSRSLIYPEVQEALLALPFAYEKLKADGEALKAYQVAEDLLTRELELVREMRGSLNQEELLRIIGSAPISAQQLRAQTKRQHEAGTLTVAVTDDGQNWLKLDTTSVIKTRSAYLSELFAQNTFQAKVLDLRDLLRLQKLLRSWQPKLTIYEDLLRAKQDQRSRQEAYLTQSSVVAQAAELASTRAKLAAEIARLAASEDYMALADVDARELYGRVTAAQQTIARLTASGQDTSDYQTRATLFGGILRWNAAQEFPARLADLQAKMALIDQQLSDINATKERMAIVLATSHDIQPLLVRAQTAARDVSLQLQQTDSLIQAQGELLRQQLDQQLASHELRLNNYLAQAHLAVARIYDAEFRKHSE
jgi:hypothetical protein